MKRLLPLVAPVLCLLAFCVLTALAAGDSPEFAVPAMGLVVTAGLSPKQLLETRGTLLNQGREIITKAKAENRELTAEENAKFDEIVKDADECKRVVDEQHTRAQAFADRERQLNEMENSGGGAGNAPQAGSQGNSGNGQPPFRGSAAPPSPRGGGAPTPEDKALAIQGWFINQSSRSDVILTQDHIQAAERVGLRLNAPQLVLNLDLNFANRRAQILNALQTTSGPAGGYLRPETFMDSLETAMLWYGGMMQVSDVIRTSSAEPIHWPTANDTTNTGRQIGEAKPIANVDPSFAKNMLYAYKFTSDEVLVSFELLRDNPFNLASLIGSMLGERLGRIINTRCTTGTGAGTIEGIVTAAPVGKTSASATAIVATELLDLMHSVDKAYRDQPGVGWMFHDNVALALRKLVDSNGRFHWVDGMQAGQPNQLFTKPVTVNNDMASAIAASAKTVLFGQLTKYKIRQVGTVRIYRLQERHRENDQDAFLAFTEVDGKLLDAGGNPIKVLQQTT